ncbi:MAG: hypothetical protein GXY55_08185, partial [Phycisphaerae bacterium]|nr:hypothetical protein [Phycisphaerae bacterium]
HQGLFWHSLDGSATFNTPDPAATPTATGLYYNRNRWYAPHLGRFLQRDPNETGLLRGFRLAFNGYRPTVTTGVFAPRDHYADGLNLYAYVRSQPVQYSDPQGLLLGLVDLGASTNAGTYYTALAGGSIGGSLALFAGRIMEGMAWRDAAIEAACFGVTVFAAGGIAGETYFALSQSLAVTAATAAGSSSSAGIATPATVVTNEMIRTAMGRSWLKASQDFISRMQVQESPMRFARGEIPEPIRVVYDTTGHWIADGHHRHIAALIAGRAIRVVQVYRVGSGARPWSDVQIIP